MDCSVNTYGFSQVHDTKKFFQQDDKIGFFSQKTSQDDKKHVRKNFGSIRTEARTRDLSRVRRAS